MKKHIVILSIFIMTVLFFHESGKGSIINSADQFKPLQKSIEVMEQNDIEVSEWSIYTKNRIEVNNKTDFHNKWNELKKILDGAEWKTEFKPQSMRVVGTRSISNDTYEQVTLVSKNPHKRKPYTYLIYEVRGSHWNEADWSDTASYITTATDRLYAGTTTIYTCVKGHASGKIEKILTQSATDLLKDFSAEPVESLNEKTFVSVSAYTDEWNAEIPVKNGKMNLQIGLRNNGLESPTTVVIGTPIITSEY